MLRNSAARLRGIHNDGLQCPITQTVPILLRAQYHDSLHSDNDVDAVDRIRKVLDYCAVTVRVSAKASSVRKCPGGPRRRLPLLLSRVPKFLFVNLG